MEREQIQDLIKGVLVTLSLLTSFSIHAVIPAPGGQTLGWYSKTDPQHIIWYESARIFCEGGVSNGNFGPAGAAIVCTEGIHPLPHLYYNIYMVWHSCPVNTDIVEINNAAYCVDVSTAKQAPSCPTSGNPIIVATGNKFQTEVDYQSQKPFGLSFVRYYNSSAEDLGTEVGIKWLHNYARRILISGSRVLAYRSNGQVFVFTDTGTNWVGDVDISDTLVETVDGLGVRTGWLYTDSNDTVETYNATGQLTQITNRAGQTQTLAYDVTNANGGDDNSATLDTVTGFTGGTLSFGYDGSGRIITMTDSEGQNYLYSYDGLGNLILVTYPDDTPAAVNDNPTRQYHYEEPVLPHHLTGLTDETGSRYVTWSYDTQGRAISSELAGGVNKETLVFNADGSVAVTNPLGKQTTYHFTALHGVKKLTQVEGHQSTNCAAANQTYTYDTNGYLESKTDWEGNITQYVHDAKGLELSRTEAFGTTDARTITTTWHPNFRLPLTISAPGQVTEFTYDAQGHLLSQATLSTQP